MFVRRRDTSNSCLSVFGVGEGRVEGVLRVLDGALHVGHGAEPGDAADAAHDTCGQDGF